MSTPATLFKIVIHRRCFMSFVKLLKTAILQRRLVNICSVKLKIDIYLLMHHYLCI